MISATVILGFFTILLVSSNFLSADNETEVCRTSWGYKFSREEFRRVHSHRLKKIKRLLRRTNERRLKTSFPSCEEVYCGQTSKPTDPWLYFVNEPNSASCAMCFYYTFTHPEDGPYVNRYQVSPCIDGFCDCEIEEMLPRYNLPEYSILPLNQNYTVKHLNKLKLNPPLPPNYLEVTRACCIAADRCCEDMITESLSGSKNGHNGIHKCPSTWDGWSCFMSTAPNGTATSPCPYYIHRTVKNLEFDPNVKYAERKCLASGHWFPNLDVKREWTDYSKCMTVDRSRSLIKFWVGIASFLLSAISIIPALFIFSYYRALKIESNAIHKQLLISFLLTAVFYIFNGLFFIMEGAPGEQLMQINHISCRTMYAIQLRYLRLTNYSWMLCEGWYLHRLLVAAFEAHETLISYYILGWGFPLISLILYSILRTIFDDSGCWLGPSTVKPWMEWISYAPCLCCLFINFILMVSIVIIMVRKLRYTHSEYEPVHYRKAVRATVMLLPIFGAHFFITIYPAKIFAYEILNVLLDGLQGFFVALIVCYSNHKVLETLKTRWKEYREQRLVMEESIHNQKTYRLSIAVPRTYSAGAMNM